MLNRPSPITKRPNRISTTRQKTKQPPCTQVQLSRCHPIRHRFSSLLRISLPLNFLQPSFQILLIFLLQLWITRRAVNLARLVMPFGEFLFRPLVMNMDLVSPVENLFHKLGGNEIHTFAVSDHQIAGHDRDTADSHRNIDTGQHHVPNWSWIDRPEVSRHIDFGDSVEIADAAVDYQASTTSGGHHVVEKIVSDDSPVHFLAEQVHDQYVAWLQHVDGGLIHEVLKAMIFRLRLRNILNQVFWDVLENGQYPRPIDTWVLNNGTALVVDRSDSIEIHDFFVFSRFTGILLTDSTDTSEGTTCGYGIGSDIDLDTVQYGIVITASNTPGYKFTNVDIGAAPGLGQAAVQVRTGGPMLSKIEINGGSQRGTWALGAYPTPATDTIIVNILP